MRNDEFSEKQGEISVEIRDSQIEENNSSKREDSNSDRENPLFIAMAASVENFEKTRTNNGEEKKLDIEE